MTLAPLTPKTLQLYPLGIAPPSDLKSLLLDNYADPETAQPSFTRIAWPTGGGLSFTIPSPSGDVPAPKLDGVIILHHTARAFWIDRTPGGNLPDCSSIDGKTGVGNPGGRCFVCPQNQFGTATRQDGTESRGKACKEVRRLYLLRPGEFTPLMIALPPSSLGAWRDFTDLLTRAGHSIRRLVVSLGLITDQSSDGIKYSKATFTVLGLLSEKDQTSVNLVSTALSPFISRVPVETEDYDTRPEQERVMPRGTESLPPRPQVVQAPAQLGSSRIAPPPAAKPVVVAPPPVKPPVTHLVGKLLTAPEGKYSSSKKLYAWATIQEGTGRSVNVVAWEELADQLLREVASGEMVDFTGFLYGTFAKLPMFTAENFAQVDSKPASAPATEPAADEEPELPF